MLLTVLALFSIALISYAFPSSLRLAEKALQYSLLHYGQAMFAACVWITAAIIASMAFWKSAYLD